MENKLELITCKNKSGKIYFKVTLNNETLEVFCFDEKRKAENFYDNVKENFNKEYYKVLRSEIF